MRPAYRAEQVRTAEAALMAVVPEGTLMARAAHGLAVECARLLGHVYGRRIVVLAGFGNNGGDALYAGAELARRGARVDALVLDPSRVHHDGLAALIRAGGRSCVAEDGFDLLGRAALIIDGIVGIGARGALRDAADELVQGTVDTPAVIVSVDVPSGVSADTGEVAGRAVRAHVTVTFGALKPGLLVGAGVEHAGEVRLVDIGLGPHLPASTVFVLEAADVAAELVPPGPADDKYTRGVVGVVAGSPDYPGAAVLCTGAALHGGAGMVRYVGAAADAVRARWPETVVHPDLTEAGRVQAWVIGPGLGTGSDALHALEHVLSADVAVLVDADAITLLAKHRQLLDDRSAPTVLTPHDREFERMFGPVGTDRIGAARRAASESGATVLLKGNGTVIANPSGDVYVNPTGTPWLGTAGSGDVLSGLAGSLLASHAAGTSAAGGGVGTAGPTASGPTASGPTASGPTASGPTASGPTASGPNASGHGTSEHRGDATRAAALAAYVHGVAGQIAATDGPPTSADVLASVRAAIKRIVSPPRRP